MIKFSAAGSQKNKNSDTKTVTENSIPSETSAKTELIWKKFLELLSDSLKAGEINTWFSVIVPKSFKDNVLTISVPSEDYYSLIESRYNKIISSITESLLGPEGKLNYEISQYGLFGENESENQKVNINKSAEEKSLFENISVNADELTSDPYNNFSSNLNQKHLFENFIKGESNELAVAAAYAISNNPVKLTIRFLFTAVLVSERLTLFRRLETKF
ncbi:MAG: hypothetical protein IPM38_04710 [Ignavibacteria bacterium]|nr:hypothetical protein [Ignavibacteria bacterium]